MMRPGAHLLAPDRCAFVLWAPKRREVAVHLLGPRERIVPMAPAGNGYWQVVAEEVTAGTPYLYRLDGTDAHPDPASHHQPRGVHEPSEVVDHRAFAWEDGLWRGIPLSGMIVYELHVGTFTPEGTFDAMIPRLTDLRELGVNTIEIMPVAAFPGERNWGYDGVYPFAVQNAYGGPAGLKRLVNACHEAGLAVVLDVVYNHIGPEGNYLSAFGPYFTDKYKTPWGSAINFDDAECQGVRDYFIENALHWFEQYHIDALRLDAIHAICDMGAKHFLRELAERTSAFSKETGRRCLLIAESDLNDTRVIRPPEVGGYGIDAQWSDDFHHALHVLLTGEQQGYYQDFGHVCDLVKAYREGFVYSGQLSPYRRRPHGNRSKDRPGEQFVVFSQNHDQVGNRLLGNRLSTLVSFEGLKLAAGAVILSPFVPLLFMGEEYGEEAPFLYFVSHGDPGLIEAVRRGRKEEFRLFQWKGEPPDPQDPATFQKAKIRWELREKGRQRTLWTFYQTLLRLRREVPALAALDTDRVEVIGWEEDRLLCLRRWTETSEVILYMNFGRSDLSLQRYPLQKGWRLLLDSADGGWEGPGTRLPEQLRGHSLAVYEVLPADHG